MTSAPRCLPRGPASLARYKHSDEIFERLAVVVSHDEAADQSLRLRSAIFGAVQWSPRRDATELEVEAIRVLSRCGRTSRSVPAAR